MLVRDAGTYNSACKCHCPITREVLDSLNRLKCKMQHYNYMYVFGRLKPIDIDAKYIRGLFGGHSKLEL